jgi:hypothetical protein
MFYTGIPGPHYNVLTWTPQKAAAEHVSIKDPGIAEAHVSAPVWVRRAEEVEDDQVLDG